VATGSSRGEAVTFLGLQSRRAAQWARRSAASGRRGLAYRVAQVCHADAGDHCGVAQSEWRGGEAFEESHSGAKKRQPDRSTTRIGSAMRLLVR
jgi:hypothetical protein